MSEPRIHDGSHKVRPPGASLQALRPYPSALTILCILYIHVYHLANADRGSACVAKAMQARESREYKTAHTRFALQVRCPLLIDYSRPNFQAASTSRHRVNRLKIAYRCLSPGKPGGLLLATDYFTVRSPGHHGLGYG